MGRGRLGYLVFCLIAAVALALAIRAYMPPEAMEAIKSTYLQTPESGP